MTRWLPYPLLTAILLLFWLLLTQSFSPGQVVLGSLVALLAAASMVALRRPSSPVASWAKAGQLFVAVALDILRSNIAVARIAFSPRARPNSAFIRLQLELRDPQALAILALIITATPGTAWVEFNRADGTLLIHVFDLVDEEGWKRLLKTRYERLLLEMFER